MKLSLNILHVDYIHLEFTVGDHDIFASFCCSVCHYVFEQLN